MYYTTKECSKNSGEVISIVKNIEAFNFFLTKKIEMKPLLERGSSRMNRFHSSQDNKLNKLSVSGSDGGE